MMDKTFDPALVEARISTRWEQAEELTQRQLESWFGVLDDGGRQALVAGLDGMTAALG